jgi:hypothetical protein
MERFLSLRAPLEDHANLNEHGRARRTQLSAALGDLDGLSPAGRERLLLASTQPSTFGTTKREMAPTNTPRPRGSPLEAKVVGIQERSVNPFGRRTKYPVNLGGVLGHGAFSFLSGGGVGSRLRSAVDLRLHDGDEESATRSTLLV